MKKIIDKNFSFLSKNFPAIHERLIQTKSSKPFILTPSKMPNILFHKRPFHSVHNPEKEALNLVKNLSINEGYIFIFMGIGLGYHIEKFKELYRDSIKKITIICIEKSIKAFLLLVKSRDISFLKDVHLFIEADPKKITEYFNSLSPLSFKGYRIIKLRGDFSLFKDYYNEIEGLFKGTLSVKISDLLTKFAFESLWMKNIIENIPWLINKRSIYALKDILKNKPALVIGAGPSLFKQLEMIKELSHNLYLIAVDTSLEPLLKSGIEPDFTVTLDAQFFNILDFHSIFTRNNLPQKSKLIADMVVYPKILKHWKGPLYFSSTALYAAHYGNIYRQSHPLIARLQNYYGNIGWLECGGSVSTTAIELALWLGAYPILVTGLDFSYTDYKTHVNSSSPYTICLGQSNRLNPLQTSILKKIRIRRLMSVHGIHGKSVLSDFVFNNYLNWFSERREYLKRVYNITADGARIPGLEHISLEKIINENLFNIKKEEVCPVSTEKLTEIKALNFLIGLKEDLISALERIKSASETDNFIQKFVRSYPFLQNSVPIALSLFNNSKSAYGYLSMLLNLIARQIDRSIERLNR